MLIVRRRKKVHQLLLRERPPQTSNALSRAPAPLQDDNQGQYVLGLGFRARV